MGRVIGYCRVSTTDQGVSGLGLEAQRAAIEAECRRRGWNLVAVHTDVTSGKSLNGRYELAAALAALAAGKADALVAAKVDRIARSTFDFAKIAKDAGRQGWALVLLEGDFDMSTISGKAMAGMMAVFAEMERDIIAERTRNAMAVVKARGITKSGKPVGRPRTIAPEVEKRIVGRRRAGKSFQVIAAELDRAGIPTPTGQGGWSWATVSRVVRRNLNERPRRRSQGTRREDLRPQEG